MSLISSFMSLLGASLPFWEWTEYCATGVVIVGCIGEYVAEFKEYPHDLNKRHRFAKRSLLLLIAGLAVELVALVRTSQLSGQIIAGLNIEAEQAMERASEADERAAKFEKEAEEVRKQVAVSNEHASRAETMAKGFEAHIAESNAVAKSAEARAAQARLELSRIQERMADRELTDGQISEIADAIKAFLGQEYDVTPYWDTKESLTIANRISEAMTRGGWKYVPPERSGFMLGGITGVQVWVHPSADEKTRRAADSLLHILNKVGIVAELRMQNSQNPKENRIHLNVGTKP